MSLTEYRIFSGYCNSCSFRHQGLLPQGIDRSIIGPGLKSLISMFVSDFKLSKRDIKNLLKELYNFNISIGTISNTESRVSNALEQPYNNLSAAAKAQENLNADETRHFENNQIHWAWIATNENLTLLMMDK